MEMSFGSIWSFEICKEDRTFLTEKKNTFRMIFNVI